MNCKATISPALSPHCRGRVLRSCALLAALTLGACASQVPPADQPATPNTPADAIALAPDLYMLPMGEDESGCAVFQPWSPSMAVIQALHWRTPTGDFTLDRDAADCAADQADTAGGADGAAR